MMIPNPNDVSKGILRAFKGDKSIRVVHEVPDGFTEIDFSGCTNLRWIGKLPATTCKLVLNGCHRLWWLPDLSKLPNLEELSVDRTNLRSIDALPASLRCLYASNCPRLRRVKVLPARVQYVHIHSNPRLSTVGAMPDSVTHYIARRCPRLKHVGKLSSALIALALADTGVKEVAELPSTLLDLDVARTPISQLPDLTKSPRLHELAVNGCTRLHGHLQLPASVRAFHAGGLTNFEVTTLGSTRCYY